MTAENSAATAAGFVGMTCYAVWPLFRARSKMLATYVGNNLAFVVHYALLDHWTAAAMNGLMSIQTLLAVGLVRAPSLRWAYYALMPALGMASLVAWRGTPSLLSLAAAALPTLGRVAAKLDRVSRHVHAPHPTA